VEPRRVAVVVALLLAALASPALAAGGHGHVYRARVGADGWALLQLPGGAHVVSIEYSVPPGWRGAAARPLLYATLPDPKLWATLGKTPVALPEEARTPRPVVASSPFATVVAVPGEPGEVVRVRALEPAGGAGEKPLMVIVVPSGDIVAREYAEKIAGLHPGLRVMVLTTGEVAARYPEAPRPRGACMPGEGDVPRYNLSLALHIVGMERELLGSGLRYLLLIGGAKEVPPIYYCSPILRELVGPKEGVVPSDYYYSDPDYDGSAEVAVGRIPFTDPVMLAGYYSALQKWVKGGDWQHYGFVSGGAPFASTLFVGEGAAAEAARQLEAMNVTVDYFFLDRGNYRGLRLAGYLGRYGIYYIMAHGSGTSLLDYVPGGLWNYDFQELLHRSEVNGLGNPGLFVLPACRDGYWDTDLVKPPFQPPSLGVELLAKGAAVGYVGFDRVAVEVIDGVALVSGRLRLSLAGADRLLLEFVKGLGSASTIGEAFAAALTAYNALPASHYRAYMAQGEEEIGTLVTRSAVLLGDPAAPAPWKTANTEAPAPAGLEVDGSIGVGAALLAPTLARYASGTMPAANPGASGVITATLPGECPPELHAYALQRVAGTTLIGMVEVNASTAETAGGCRIVLHLPPGAPGLVRLLAVTGRGVAAYYVAAAGAYVDEKRGLLVLRGLDLLGVVGDEPLLLQVDNVTAATLEGGKPVAVVPLRALAGQAAGNATVQVVPMYDTAGIYGGSLVASEAARLATLFRVHAQLPAVQPPGAGPVAFAPAESSRHGLGAEAGGGGQLAATALFSAAAAAAAMYTALRRRCGGRSRAGEPPGYLM